MEPAEAVQKSVTRRKAPEKKRRFYGADFKLQIVKKHLEESVPVSVIEQECGVSKGTMGRWVRAYRSNGEAVLEEPAAGESKARVDKNYQEFIIPGMKKAREGIFYSPN